MTDCPGKAAKGGECLGISAAAFLGSLRILAGGEQTGGLYFAFESETAPAQPGGGFDLHAHDQYDESEYVVTGEREIVVEDQHWQAGSGLFVMAPRRTRHTMRTVGSGPSRWLHFFSPAGIERCFVSANVCALPVQAPRSSTP